MDSRSEYRAYLMEAFKYIKLKRLLHDLKIDHGNFRRFMNGDDRMLSMKKLNLLVDALESRPIGSNINILENDNDTNTHTI